MIDYAMKKEGNFYKNKCGCTSHVATLLLNLKTRQPEKDLIRVFGNRSL